MKGESSVRREPQPNLGWPSDPLDPLFEKKGVLRAVVFGSLAGGNSTRRSDLDLIVVVSADKRFPDRYDDLLSLTPGQVYRLEDARRGLKTAGALLAACQVWLAGA